LIVVIRAEKRTYNGLPDLMTRVAQEEMNRMNEDISECKVVYMPQVRAVFHASITSTSANYILSLGDVDVEEKILRRSTTVTFFTALCKREP